MPSGSRAFFAIASFGARPDESASDNRAPWRCKSVSLRGLSGKNPAAARILSLKNMARRTLPRQWMTGLTLLLWFPVTVVYADSNADQLLSMAREALRARGVPILNGEAWQSQIQAPNYQTDIDVGVAGIGMSFLQAYEVSADSQDLDAAVRAGRWMVAVQRSDGQWPDYSNPASVSAPQVSEYGFASLDDGAAGQCLFLTQLYRMSRDRLFLESARRGARWLLKTAEQPAGYRCPEEQCSWRWSHPPLDGDTRVYLGIGSGMAGIVVALIRLAEDFKDPQYLAYAKAGAAYLEAHIASDGSVPEAADGGRSYTGLYQGGAGVAYAFLSLYRSTHDRRWLSDAQRILRWLAANAVRSAQGMAWTDAIGPMGDSSLHTSQAWGSAGIGWVALQAYHLTHRKLYRRMAMLAGDWLLATAVRADHGIWWPENVGEGVAYTSLDVGVAGISYFLFDLGTDTRRAKYLVAAHDGAQWIQSVADRQSGSPQWATENCVGCGGGRHYGESSRHWGAAGILSLGARLAGGHTDMPRDVPALR